MFWIAKINKEGNGIHFDKPLVRARFADWASKNIEEMVKIEPYQTVSYKARGFFEGAIIPAYALWSENYDHKNKGDLLEIRDFFKLKFNSKKFIEPNGDVTLIPRSTTELTNEQFRVGFVESIQDYFMENMIPFPDAELFKKWRDTIRDKRPREETYIDWLHLNNLEVDGSVKDLDI